MENPALPGYLGPRGVNFWLADPDLRAAAGSRVDAARCEEFGAYAAGTLDALVETAHRNENLPRLTGGAIAYCPEQIEARRALARAIYQSGPLSLAERMTRAVLANYCGEGGITCPLAMTEGLIGLLEKRGTPEQKKLLPKLRSDEADWALTGGQFVTERQGGSNVAANETQARDNGDGTWSLTGLKWFCSNPGEVWVTTAKAGDSGVVGLFLVRRRNPDGSLNGHRILRQKPIGGTRGKATVEVEYDGAKAELIGKPREGLVILLEEIISVSRLHVAAAALGFAGRALLEAEAFAAWREVGGRKVAELAAPARALAALRLERAAMLDVFYAAVDAASEAAADAELLVPLAKVEVSRRASAIVRGAQLLIGGHGILDDFSPLNRLADDALVNEIWEGTHPILAGHVLKALKRPAARRAFAARCGASEADLLALALAHEDGPDEALTAAVAALI